MQIQHNLSAATANRNLNATQKQYQVSTQRLSSGYRINSAADDAAGLTISEKMRWQIRGMNRASDNVEDGISLTQVADGALQEVHAMLQRMVELTVQAANDSNTDEDREALQREINQIKTEINRISTDTEYNTIKIFKPTSVPKLSGNPTDLMVYWSDDTYPDGSRKGAGILYGGKRYAYENMKLNYDADGNISAGTYPVEVTGEDGNPLTINLIFSGGNKEPAGRFYELIPDEHGVSIDRILYPWSKITDGKGNSIQEFNNKGGTYFFEHAGMTISFDVEEGADLVSVIASRDKDELDIYDLCSEKTTTSALVTPTFKLSQTNLTVTPANSHFFPNSTSSNSGEYEMKFDPATNDIVMQVPNKENQNNGNVEVGRWKLDSIGLPDASWKPGSGVNAANSTVEQEINTNFLLPNTNIYSDISFTVDSESTKNDLINSINTDWKIDVEFKNCEMYIKPDKHLSAGNPVSVSVSHSNSLDNYGTHLNMGLIGGRPLTLTTTKDTSGGTLSFTMQGGQGQPQTFTATESFSQIENKIDSINVVDYAKRFATKLQNEMNGYGSAKQTYQYSLSLRSPANDSITISAQEDITGWFTPDMFTKTRDPNTGRWKVTYNDTNANKNTLDTRKGELKQHILDAFENTDLDAKTAGPIQAELKPYHEDAIENIRYTSKSTESGRELMIQSSSRAWDAIPISLHAMNTGILDVETVDVSSYQSAGTSLNQIYGAIDRVSEIRTEFGVTHNRLENAMSIDDIMAENVQAAESRLRDADMAKERVANALHQILLQSGQSMLAQSNQSPENILKLISS